jgi:hypothetical protein
MQMAAFSRRLASARALFCRRPGLRRRIENVRRSTKAVHPECPLQAHERALHSRQQQERQQKRQRQPHGPVHPNGRCIGALHPKHATNRDVAHDTDGEIGGRVIGAMMMQFLATCRTAISHLEERAKQSAFTAAWTPQPKPPAHRGPRATRSRVARFFDHVTGHKLFSGRGERATCLKIGSNKPTLQHDKCTRGSFTFCPVLCMGSA